MNFNLMIYITAPDSNLQNQVLILLQIQLCHLQSNQEHILCQTNTNTKHHLKYRNFFGIFCTALHTASSQGVSLAVDQYSFSTKSAQNSFPDFKWCLV